MVERKIKSPTLKRVDRYLRREDTVFARALREISPESGTEYLLSSKRRQAETLMAAAMSGLAIPIIGVLGALVKFEDHGDVFFRHPRTDKDGQFLLCKIRTMVEGAEKLNHQVNPETILPEKDPRNTRMGAKLRKYEIEELPQLFQVLGGRLRLVGIRAASSRAEAIMSQKRPKTYQNWRTKYYQDRGSLFSLNSVINTPQQKKNPLSRYHPDVFYAENMSLGLDVYIVLRCLINTLDKILQKT